MTRVALALAGLIIAGHVGGALGQTLYVRPPVAIEQPQRRYVPPYCDRECQWHRNHWRREREHYYDRRDWR